VRLLLAESAQRDSEGRRTSAQRKSPVAYSAQVHPVFLQWGSFQIPSYGAMTALGVLAALYAAQRTARMADVPAWQVWNLCIVALCAALAAQRLLLLAANWGAVRGHMAGLQRLALIHHPLVTCAGAVAGLGGALWYARSHRMPLFSTADALAAPLALGFAFEQIGGLLAGSGYGTESSARWAVTYTSPLAAFWSGTPLGVPLHPVQAYAAVAFLALAISLYLWLPARRQPGDVAGLWLMGAGVAIYITEIWRDPEGRGAIFNGALDGPQVGAIVLVLIGAVVLLERKGRAAHD
jgi:phosphatidylglycerol:prolipoprotein diacylglycerol transferase